MMKSLNELQAKDFTKWVRGQVRQFGRRADIADIQFSAVEYKGQKLFSDWSSISYYMMDEDGMMELKAGRWLDICLLEDQGAYLIAR